MAPLNDIASFVDTIGRRIC